MTTLAFILPAIILAHIASLIINDIHQEPMTTIESTQHQEEPTTKKNRSRAVTLRGLKMATMIAQANGIDYKIVRSRTRIREVSIVRQVTVFLIHRELYPMMTNTEIGEIVGVDHATVNYTIKKVKAMIEVNDRLMMAVYMNALTAINEQ